MVQLTIEIAGHYVGFVMDEDGNVCSCLVDGDGDEGMILTRAGSVEACREKTRLLLEQ